MKCISIGIIGFGNIGKKRYYALKKIKNYKINIKYIVDINKENIKDEKIAWFKNWKEIKNINVDLIIISTPTKISEVISQQLVGKYHMLIEKPITTNIKIMQKLLTVSNKNKKILKTGYNLRFDNGLKIVKKKLKKKIIGKIYYCKLTYANGTAKTNTNAVGSLVDMGTHAINLIEWFFEKDIMKLNYCQNQKNEFLDKKKIDNGFCLFKVNKLTCLIHQGFCNWKNKFLLEIYGSKGFIEVNSLPKWGKQVITSGLRTYPSGVPKVKKNIFKKDYSWINEISTILDLISNKKKEITQFNNEGLITLKNTNKIKNS